jgi:hypothetical protein
MTLETGPRWATWAAAAWQPGVSVLHRRPPHTQALQPVCICASLQHSTMARHCCSAGAGRLSCLQQVLLQQKQSPLAPRKLPTLSAEAEACHSSSQSPEATFGGYQEAQRKAPAAPQANGPCRSVLTSNQYKKQYHTTAHTPHNHPHNTRQAPLQHTLAARRRMHACSCQQHTSLPSMQRRDWADMQCCHLSDPTTNQHTMHPQETEPHPGSFNCQHSLTPPRQPASTLRLCM